MTCDYLCIPAVCCFARIDLRDTTIYIQDGLAGTAVVDQSSAEADTDTVLDIGTVELNTDDTDLVPIGARFTHEDETSPTIHTVTARTPSDDGPTTQITFSPALGAGTYDGTGQLTFLPQRIEIKVGDGNLTYTETDEYAYELDRGRLDTVRRGDDQPLQVDLEFAYEAITTGTSEAIAPMDAIKRKGGAAEWVSSSDDKCEPYSVDIVVLHEPPCGTKQNEQTTFPDFRSESRNPDFSEASISISGTCNVREPEVERGV